MRRLILCGLLVSVCLASWQLRRAEADENSYRFVLAKQSCAPHDASAVDLLFYQSKTECGADTKPFMRVSFWERVSAGAQLNFATAESTQSGAAYLVSGSETWKRITSGWVKITTDSETELKGELELRLGDRIERGTFSAQKCRNVMLCG